MAYIVSCIALGSTRTHIGHVSAGVTLAEIQGQVSDACEYHVISIRCCSRETRETLGTHSRSTALLSGRKSLVSPEVMLLEQMACVALDDCILKSFHNGCRLSRSAACRRNVSKTCPIKQSLSTGATARSSQLHVPEHYHRTDSAGGPRDCGGECYPRVPAACLHAVCDCKSTQHRFDPTTCCITKVAQWLDIVTRPFLQPGGQLLHKLAVEMEAKKHSRANSRFPFGEPGHHWEEANIQCLH